MHIFGQIEAKIGIKVKEQRLIFGGKNMDNDHYTLASDYGVQEECTLHLVLRLPGGLELEHY